MKTNESAMYLRRKRHGISPDYLRVLLIGIFVGASALSENLSRADDGNQNGDPKPPGFQMNSPYYFDGTISRQTLENDLDHSVTMGYFLVPGKPEGYEFPYKDDDIRLIRNIGAKFIGRAIYRWG